MLKLSVKLSFLVGVLAVCIALVESFIHQNSLSKLKLCLLLEDKTVAQYQTADWGFFSKNNFIPSAA